MTESDNTNLDISDYLVQHFFEKQAVLTPFKTAVISGRLKLTYQELDNLSNQLANYLVSLGVIPGDFVGICIERSVDMVLSVLGVLKAGCCYLPLDPSFPDDRISLRWNTERPVTLREHGGASVLVGNNIKLIRKEYLIALKKTRTPIRPEPWDGHTAGRCLQEILQYNRKEI